MFSEYSRNINFKFWFFCRANKLQKLLLAYSGNIPGIAICVLTLRLNPICVLTLCLNPICVLSLIISSSFVLTLSLKLISFIKNIYLRRVPGVSWWPILTFYFHVRHRAFESRLGRCWSRAQDQRWIHPIGPVSCSSRRSAIWFSEYICLRSRFQVAEELTWKRWSVSSWWCST